MSHRDAFATYHPFVNLLYFGLVFVCSFVLLHPLCLAISLGCALTYSILLNGRRTVGFSLVYLLPLFVLAAVLNPLFSHGGVTILAYLPSGNPLTLESIAYGAGSAAVLLAVMLWFGCYNVVMTTDKFVYLFGRVMPALSLVLSMTLRFVPRFRAQLGVIATAQTCLGRDAATGSLRQRAKNGIAILSILVTWALENAMESADSMKSRGYGLPGRTAFSLYSFDRRDAKALVFLCVCGGYLLVGAACKGVAWRYFPSLQGVGWTGYAVSLFVCYFLLSIAPVAMHVAEDWKWNSLHSTI